MWPHFLNLLVSSLRAFWSALGTTSLGWFLPIIVFLVSQVIVHWLTYKRSGWVAVQRHYARGFGVDFWLGLLPTASVFLLIFCWQIVVNIYADHVSLVRDAASLAQENRKLLREKQEQNEYKASALNSFALTNTVAAIGFLRNGGRPETNAPCRLRITAPKENEIVSRFLFVIASGMGCNVAPIEDPTISLDIESQILDGAIPSTVLVHAAKGQQYADGFVVELGNTFTVRRASQLPPGGDEKQIWIQIGPGDVWRKR